MGCVKGAPRYTAAGGSRDGSLVAGCGRFLGGMEAESDTRAKNAWVPGVSLPASKPPFRSRNTKPSPSCAGARQAQLRPREAQSRGAAEPTRFSGSCQRARFCPSPGSRKIQNELYD
ncbi:hypothetical protein P7K49_027599 [Saguinus oedipus]|uniref:Uncharacterized protein n=1 Tax=Saguinus oedipus TaxID=9490 RepID=A0ABQ9UAE7_SAGOE|nr:hypothetical protein P7K49_027599 [Saguinus oedipus]